MAFVDLRVPVAPGVHLRVRHRPGGPARPFLLVHGLASNARLWDGVAGHLGAAGHPCFAVDLRSHGESDAPPDGYDTATAADDLAAVADHLGLTGLLAAGQSWGGNVVVRLAARRPDLVAGAALVDGGWTDLSAQFPSWEQCAATLRPPELDGRKAVYLRDFLRRTHPDWSAAAIDATLANLRQRSDGTLERRLSIDRHMAIVRSMWDDPPRSQFAEVKAPVLLVPAVPRDAEQAQRRRAAVEAAAATLRQATIREYPGADHDVHAQRPGELAADLLEFEKRLP